MDRFAFLGANYFSQNIKNIGQTIGGNKTGMVVYAINQKICGVGVKGISFK